MANPTPEGARRAGALVEQLDEINRQELNAKNSLQAIETQRQMTESELAKEFADLGIGYEAKPPQQPKIPEVESPPHAEGVGGKEGVETGKHETKYNHRPAYNNIFFIVAGLIAAVVVICFLVGFIRSEVNTSEIVEKVDGLRGDLFREIRGLASQVKIFRGEVVDVQERTRHIETQNNDLRKGLAEIRKGISSKPLSPAPSSKKVVATGNGKGTQNSSLEFCNLKVVDIRDQRKVLGFVVVEEVGGKILLSKHYALSRNSPSQSTKYTSWPGKGNCLANKTLVKERWSTVISDLGIFFESKPL